MAFLSGTILDAHGGSGVRGVEVHAAGLFTDSAGTAISDDQGFYLIEPLDPGSGYVVNAVSASYSYRHMEDVTVVSPGVELSVGMVRLGAVSGNVVTVGSDGVSGSVADVPIYFTQVDEPSWGIGETRTDVSGNYLIETLDASSLLNPSGSLYDVLVAPDQNYSYVLDQVWVPPRNSAENVVVRSYEVRPRGLIAGVFTSGGTPLGGVTISLYTNLTGLMLEDDLPSTDANGNFEMWVNAPGDYRLVAQGEGTAMVDAVVSVSPGARTQVVFDVAGPGSIAGIVTDLDGQPVSGARVQLWPAAGRGPRDVALTGDNGRYVLNAVNPYSGWLITVGMPTAEIDRGYPRQDDVAITSGVATIVDLQGDVEPPTCEILAPQNNNTVAASVAVTGTAVDNQMLSLVVVEVDGREVHRDNLSNTQENAPVDRFDISFVWDTSEILDGVHEMVLSVYDLAGNCGRHTIQVDVMNDTSGSRT